MTDPGLHAALGQLAAAKYGFGGDEPPDPDQVWFFRLSLVEPAAHDDELGSTASGSGNMGFAVRCRR